MLLAEVGVRHGPPHRAMAMIRSHVPLGAVIAASGRLASVAAMIAALGAADLPWLLLATVFATPRL